MRLARAADRIVKGRGALGTIALEVGFTDQAQFSRAFKQQYGITPSAYRAQGGIPVTPPEDRSSGP